MSTSTPSSTSKRGLSATTTPSNTTSSTAPSRSPTRQPTAASNTASTTTTPARAGSMRSKNGPPPSAKAAAKRNSIVKDPTENDDAKAETAALIDDLKDQLRKTESASEQYQKELQVAQSRLDEALAEQSKLEETANQHAETIASLESQLRDLSRQKTDLETQRDANEASWTKEREAASNRETELNQVVQRLKDTLAQREYRQSMEGEPDPSKRPISRGRAVPAPDENTGISTPPLSRRDSSQNQTTSQLLLQKDRVIEDLRLELAEATVKVMEVDRAGGGKLQDLEKQLLEVRMTNAKLMEDNESYQFLLQERTLNGTFANRFRTATPSEPGATTPAASGTANEGSTLADELDNASTDAEADIEEMKEEVTERRRMEKEMSALKDQNKAMTLYIDKIITKLLASDHYESIFDGTAGKETGATDPAADAAAIASATGDVDTNKDSTAPSLLQRAGSIFGNRSRPIRPSSRVNSQQTTGEPDLVNKPLPTPNEDPTTAPSVPLRRGDVVGRGGAHRRTGSDRASQQGSSYTTFTTRTPSGTSNRPATPSGSRNASLSTASPPRDGVILEDSDPPDAAEVPVTKVLSDVGHRDSTDVASTSSPPRSTGASSVEGSRTGSGSGGPAVFSGSSRSMRPLKLVQERAEADAERKKQNRGSWAGWFNKATENLNIPGMPQGGYGGSSGSSSGQPGQQ